MIMKLRDQKLLEVHPHFVSLSAAAQQVCLAWSLHQERPASPGRPRAPASSEPKVSVQEITRTRQIFLKALDALPLVDSGVTRLLEDMVAQVRTDIPCLTAIYTHPQTPCCAPGDLALLFAGSHRKWYAPEGLGVLVSTMLERGALAAQGVADSNLVLMAVQIGSAEGVSALLAGGASPEGSGSSKSPVEPAEHPLTLACALGHVDCVKALLVGGAIPHHRLIESELKWDLSQQVQGQSLNPWRQCFDMIAAKSRAVRMDQAWTPVPIDGQEKAPGLRALRPRI